MTTTLLSTFKPTIAANGALVESNVIATSANVSTINAGVFVTVTGQDVVATANGGYNQANTATTIAVNAYATANAGNTNSLNAYSAANTANTNALNAYAAANNEPIGKNAYYAANTANVNALNAYAQANNGYLQANSAFSQANIATTTANGAYTTANNALPKAGGTMSGNLIMSGAYIGIGPSAPSAPIDFGTYQANSKRIIGTYTTGNLFTGIGMDSATAGIRLAGDYTGSLLADVGWYTSDGNYTWNSTLKITPSNITMANVNLGLGVTPSAWSGYKVFQVGGASLWSPSNSAYLSSNLYYNGSSRVYIANGYAGEYEIASGQHLWYIAPSGTANANVSLTQVMSLTSSYLLFNTSTFPSGLTGCFFIQQSSSGNMGGLHVTASSGSTQSTYIANDGTNGYIGTTYGTGSSFQPLILRTSDTNRVRIDANGNMSIGTSGIFGAYPWGGSAKAIEIGIGGSCIYNQGSAYTVISQNQYWNGTNDIYVTSAASSKYYQASGAHYWSVAPSGSAGANVSSNTVMTLDNNGNLLLGSASASYLLSGSETGISIKSPSNKAAGVKVQSPNSTNTAIELFAAYGLDVAGLITGSNTTSMAFYTNSTETARITPAGNLGIGISTPQANLHIGSGSVYVQGTDTGSTTITSARFNIQVGPAQTRSATAGTYYGGIAFNHLLNYSGSTTYNGSPQAWIGTRLYSTYGSELDYLTFATKSGTNSTDIPVERMCIDPYGNVGIGNTSPTASITTGPILQIGSPNVSGASNNQGVLALAHYNSSLTNWRVWNLFVSDNDNFTIRDAGGVGANTFDYLTITHSSGYVGIANTNPQDVLTVDNGTSNTGAITISSNGIKSAVFYGCSGSTTLNSLRSNPIVFQINGSEISRFDGSGRLGIGTTSPQYKLHVAGSTTYSTTDDAATVLKVASTTSQYPTFPGEATAIAITKTGEKYGWRMLSQYVADTYSGMDFHLQVSADSTPSWATKMFVEGLTGNVGIGTTSPGYLLDVAGNIRSTTNINLSGSFNASFIYMPSAYSGSGGNPQYIANWASPSAGWGIGPDTGSNDNMVRLGQTTVGSTAAWNGTYCNLKVLALTQTSDYRIKQNVVNYPDGALQKILALRPVTFNFNNDDRKLVGFIAHEVQEQIPEIVRGTKDQVDAQGDPVIQSVDYPYMVAVLTKAIQEQQAIIEQLKAKVGL